MSDKMNDVVKEYARFGLGRQIWKRILTILAVITVFITVYMLILPAITQEVPTYCGYEEHTHDDSCYEYVEKCNCDEEHEHFSECYVKVKTLTCLKTVHTHNDYCFVEPTAPTEDVYNDEYDACITPEHTHLDSCYDEDGDVLCGQVEHKHSKACIWGAPENDAYRVNNVIDLIDKLPETDEVEEKFNEFNETGDYESYETYYKKLYDDSLTAYAYYEDLGPELRKSVTNKDKLLSYEWVYDKEDYKVTDDKTVHQVNKYQQAQHLLVYGDSVRNKVGTKMSFTYWDVIRVELDSRGDLYVAEIVTKDGTKLDYKATTTSGFILLVYNEKITCNVGDYVTVSFDYKNTSSGYKASGYGTVNFNTGKGDRDNTSLLHAIKGADTYELIKVNLYDYGSNINDKYNQDKVKYPGFQQDKGTTSNVTSFNGSSFNFGNNITSDLAAGQSSVTTRNINPGTINEMNPDDVANRPSINAMNLLIGEDGYPKLANGESLSWLFTDGVYAKKQNTDNINGLFQRNDTTGEYYYNSHWNHAQFEPKTNTFTLYKEKITPNFMMYPFGNFMPFFDIVHDSKRSSDINKAYLQSIVKSANYKVSKGASSEYSTLATRLTQFISLMDSTYKSGWSAKDCVNEYFKVSGIPKTYASNSELSEYYTLDYDEPSNFYFGMDMEMNFIQPQNGLTGITGKEEMVFYFTGDDDVWVYIDGVLFLDLSGIHRHVGGKIDFVNGMVYYYALDKNIGDVSDEPYQSMSFAEILTSAGKSADVLNAKGTFHDYSIHNFKFYYMERGAGSGVCRMNFNLPLMKENSISISKELSVNGGDTSGILGDPLFTFSVLKAVNGQKTEEAFVDEGTLYEVYDSAGNFIENRTVGANGTVKIRKNEVAVISGIDSDLGEYYVRELFDPNIFEQYENVQVDGSNTTSVGNIAIGSDVFVGYDSPIKNIAAGNTTFSYSNVVDLKKLGTLSLKKTVVASEDFLDRVYDFAVVIDGKKLEKGYEYEVIAPDGTVSKRTVETEGIISLKADETVVIHNLLAGAQYTIEEKSESAESFIVTYENNGEITYGNVVSGTVYPSVEIEMNVTNSEKGTTVVIPGDKTLLNATGVEEKYTFTMEQCTDKTGSEVISSGQSQTVAMPIKTGKVTTDFSFILNYTESDVPKGKTKLYYRISEVVDSGKAGYTVFDSSVYVAEVTVVKSTSDISATLTGMYKDGESIGKGSSADFVNELTSSLVISKTVEGNGVESSYNTAFKFNIALTKDGEPLSGTYEAVKVSADGTKQDINVTFDAEGNYTTSLKHGESLTIKGISIGTAYAVKETVSGYYVYNTIGGGERVKGASAKGELALGKNDVAFYNYTMKELPATGGMGVYGVYALGSLFIGFALALLIIKKRKEKIYS